MQDVGRIRVRAQVFTFIPLLLRRPVTAPLVRKACALGVRRSPPRPTQHVPRRFYDLYPNNGTFPTAMPLAKHKLPPTGMPTLAFIDNAWPAFKYGPGTDTPGNLPGGAIADNLAALGRWGYYASVSFTDYNVGMILDGVDRLGLADRVQPRHCAA